MLTKVFRYGVFIVHCIQPPILANSTQNPLPFPACYPHAQELLEKNTALYHLFTNLYGKESPFNSVPTIIELTVELQQTTAYQALSQQNKRLFEQSQHLFTLLQQIDVELFRVLEAFATNINRHHHLHALMLIVQTTKCYIDEYLSDMAENSHTYRKLHNNDNRFLPTFAALSLGVPVFKILGILTGTFGVYLGGKMIWKKIKKALNKKARNLHHSVEKTIQEHKKTKNSFLKAAGDYARYKKVKRSHWWWLLPGCTWGIHKNENRWEAFCKAIDKTI